MYTALVVVAVSSSSSQCIDAEIPASVEAIRRACNCNIVSISAAGEEEVPSSQLASAKVRKSSVFKERREK